MKKRLTAITLALAMTLGLTACGNTSNQNQQPSGESGDPASDEPIVLRFADTDSADSVAGQGGQMFCDLVEERTGANDMNSFYKLNPQVSDLPDKLAKEINGVKLLVMGTVDTGGSGCVCPEHVMLKAILTSLTFRKDDVVIMDMEAGLEHLGRGTASMMDQFIVVIEPGARSVQTYERIKQLAADIGVTKVRVVANKIRDESDRAFIRSRIPEEDLLGFIRYNADVIDADRKGLSPYDQSPEALEDIRAIKAKIDAQERN